MLFYTNSSLVREQSVFSHNFSHVTLKIKTNGARSIKKLWVKFVFINFMYFETYNRLRQIDVSMKIMTEAGMLRRRMIEKLAVAWLF